MDDHVTPLLADRFRVAAHGVLDGTVHDIRVRTLGRAHIFNAGKELSYRPYTALQEFCKGLICTVEDDRIDIVAPCFPKFYNLGERPDLDAQFHALLDDPGAVVHFPEKIDGTCIRFYVHPDTGDVMAATRGTLDGAPGGDSGDPLNNHGLDFGSIALGLASAQHPAILDPVVLHRYTPVFELIHPQNRIITNYGDRKELVLLAVFDKERGCRELTRRELEAFAQMYALRLVDTFAVNHHAWDAALATLHAQWDGTDREGTVVTIERDGELVLRVKVKSAAYIAIMRSLYYCTVDRVLAFVAAWGTQTWDAFRARLLTEIPSIPEEALPFFEAYFRRCCAYCAHIDAEVDAVVAAYDAFVAQHGAIADQKAFALLVKNRPDATHFFQLRRHGMEGRATARARIAEFLRKNMTVQQFAKLPDDDAA